MLVNELEPLRSCPQHVNVVGFYGICIDGKKKKNDGTEVPVIYIAQELLPNGDLYDYLVPIRMAGDMAIRLVIKQVMNGIKHMRDNGYTHRDIKLENICLDAEFNPKIIDWGFAKAYQPGD